jgi:APA family basic amino acid/polyamine antiporter
MDEKQDLKQRCTFFARIFKTKTPDQLINDASKNALKKTLGVFDLTVLGIGAIIGAGIFTLSGTAAVGSVDHPGAGPALMISFIFAGVACALAALCYAEFASMIPVAGSAYTYTFATLGQLAAWIIGWILLLEYAIGNITVACGWSGYLFNFLKGFSFLPKWLVDPPVWLVNDYRSAILKLKSLHVANPEAHIPHITPDLSFTLFNLHFHLPAIPFCVNLPALLIIAVIVAFLYKGIQESTRMAAIMVLLKTAVILLFIFAGMFYIKPAHWVPFAPNGFSGIIAGAFLVFFAYIGFDAVSTAAEEAKNATRDIPVGIMTSLTICPLIYMAVAAVLTGIIPWNQIDAHAPVAAALRIIHLDWAAGLIALGAVAGLTSVLLVMQLGATRILFAMSRDRLLPSVISKLHPRFKTPHINTILCGLLVCVGTFFLDLDAAAQLCSIGTLTVFAIVCIGVIILKVTDPERVRPFTVPSTPSMISIGILFALVGLGIGYYLKNMIYGSVIGAIFGAIAGLAGDLLKFKALKFFSKIAIPFYGAIICFALAFMGVPQRAFFQFIVWVAVGLAIYFIYGYRKSNMPVEDDEDHLVTVEEETLQNV